VRTSLLSATLAALVGLASTACVGDAPPPPRVAPPPAAPALPPPLPPEAPPTSRLPGDVRPLHYSVVLEIAPERASFSGTVEIALALSRPRDVIWLHGRGLVGKQAVVRADDGSAIAARFDQVDATGLAALRLARPVGPGTVHARIVYDAPFGAHGDGLARVVQAGEAYAFTQLEPTFAREVFPCLDEPAFKAPFAVTLFVPPGLEALSNAPAIDRVRAPNGMDRVTFAETPPLPSYLLAVGVGPLDVLEAAPLPPNGVRKRPLPLRGVAAKGRGAELTWAIARTGEIVDALERYFGTEYPFDKLDLVAVPDKQGAMENPGLVTFREWLLLVDGKTASFEQRRAFDSVMAHELAHQWFGNLVTMPWWDDLWLNEAFATWMGRSIVRQLYASDRAEITEIERVHAAMGDDSLTSARRIHEPVASMDDVMNAFDAITYTKGGAVLAMFERWLGPETFQRGIRSYLAAHARGTATTDDLLVALSAAAGKDVATPFRTFLQQAGVPEVDVKPTCDGGKPGLALEQSRWLPAGSTGDPKRTWQIPVCVRYPVGKEVKELCSLLTEPKGAVALEGGSCDGWVMPNADAAGYYRWSLPPADLANLVKKGYSRLSERERLSLHDSVRAGLARGTTSAVDGMKALERLARDPSPSVAGAPLGLLRQVHDDVDDAKLRAAIGGFGAKLYARRFEELGFEPRRARWGEASPEAPESAIFRRELVGFLANVARDARVRAEAKKRGLAYVGHGKDGAIHADAVEPSLAGTTLAIAAQDADARLFDELEGKLATVTDEAVRTRVLAALGSVRDPKLAARALALALDPRLRHNEITAPLEAALGDVTTREAAFGWLVDHVDPLVDRLGRDDASWLPWSGAVFCDRAHAEKLAAVFGPRLAKLEGGPRNLAGAVEATMLCAARREVELPGWKASLQGRR
jgi:alanyl aminopeptidase